MKTACCQDPNLNGALNKTQDADFELHALTDSTISLAKNSSIQRLVDALDN